MPAMKTGWDFWEKAASGARLRPAKLPPHFTSIGINSGKFRGRLKISRLVSLLFHREAKPQTQTLHPNDESRSISSP